MPVVDTEYRTESDRKPAEAVFESVAKASDVDPLDLPPLYEAIDPSVLRTLFRHGKAPNREPILSFQFDGWNVFVRADGRIRVCDPTQPTKPRPVFERHPT